MQEHSELDSSDEEPTSMEGAIVFTSRNSRPVRATLLGLALTGVVLTTSLGVSTASTTSARAADPGRTDGTRAGSTTGRATPIDVQFLNLADVHGYIRPHDDQGNGTIVDPDGNRIVVGGGPYISAHLAELSKGKANSFRFTSGDSFSGWPEEVAWHKDEPTIEFLNYLGIQFNNVGNHELDISERFLVDHMWKGQCSGTVDVDDCFKDSSGKGFHGSDFPHLTGNIVDRATGKTITPPYVVKYVRQGDGPRVPVGFINLTTENGVTETMSYQPHLKANPLVESANKYAAELRKKGVKAIVVAVHEGATHDGHYQNCVDPRGPAIDLARQASPDIDAIFAGHWHTAFNCSVDDPAGNPRPVVEASYHGKLVNETNVKVDPGTRDIIRSETTSVNRPVTRDITPDPKVATMVDYWLKRKQGTGARAVAEIGGDLNQAADDSGETTLGNAAADAMYAASGATDDPADLAIVPNKVHKGSTPMAGNLDFASSGDPADAEGRVLYSEWRRAFGYGNPVLTVTVTGQNLHNALEGQWQGGKFAPLAVSKSVSYAFDAAKPEGDKVDPADVLINGEALALDKTYRLAGLTYNLRGLDGTAGLAGFTEPVRGSIDRDSLLNYLREHPGLTPPALDRVTAR